MICELPFVFTSVFETTIRYVGGLLSAYELSGKERRILVEKAEEVAQQLTYAWVGVGYFWLSTFLDHLAQFVG